VTTTPPSNPSEERTQLDASRVAGCNEGPRPLQEHRRVVRVVPRRAPACRLDSPGL
jgi:hypothetical protein